MVSTIKLLALCTFFCFSVISKGNNWHSTVPDVVDLSSVDLSKEELTTPDAIRNAVNVRLMHQAGVRLLILRGLYHREGQAVHDIAFFSLCDSAQKAGLKVGVTFNLLAEKSANAQLSDILTVLNEISQSHLTQPILVILNTPDVLKNGTLDRMADVIVGLVPVFNGKYPGIYPELGINDSWLQTIAKPQFRRDLAVFERCWLWISQYRLTPPRREQRHAYWGVWPDFVIWQYSPAECFYSESDPKKINVPVQLARQTKHLLIVPGCAVAVNCGTFSSTFLPEAKLESWFERTAVDPNSLAMRQGEP
jgi:hypothetical protein